MTRLLTSLIYATPTILGVLGGAVAEHEAYPVWVRAIAIALPPVGAWYAVTFFELRALPGDER